MAGEACQEGGEAPASRPLTAVRLLTHPCTTFRVTGTDCAAWGPHDHTGDSVLPHSWPHAPPLPSRATQRCRQGASLLEP